MEFFDSDKKTSRPGTMGEEGTGFGMPLVKSYIEKFGGTIDLKSKSIEDSPHDHGTIICLILACAAPAMTKEVA